MKYELVCADGYLLLTKEDGETVRIGDMNEEAEDQQGNFLGMSWIEAEINGYLLWADADEMPYAEEGF